MNAMHAKLQGQHTHTYTHTYTHTHHTHIYIYTHIHTHTHTKLQGQQPLLPLPTFNTGILFLRIIIRRRLIHSIICRGTDHFFLCQQLNNLLSSHLSYASLLDVDLSIQSSAGAPTISSSASSSMTCCHPTLAAKTLRPEH